MLFFKFMKDTIGVPPTVIYEGIRFTRDEDLSGCQIDWGHSSYHLMYAPDRVLCWDMDKLVALVKGVSLTRNSKGEEATTHTGSVLSHISRIESHYKVELSPDHIRRLVESFFSRPSQVGDLCLPAHPNDNTCMGTKKNDLVGWSTDDIVTFICDWGQWPIRIKEEIATKKPQHLTFFNTPIRSKFLFGYGRNNEETIPVGSTGAIHATIEMVPKFGKELRASGSPPLPAETTAKICQVVLTEETSGISVYLPSRFKHVPTSVAFYVVSTYGTRSLTDAIEDPPLWHQTHVSLAEYADRMESVIRGMSNKKTDRVKSLSLQFAHDIEALGQFFWTKSELQIVSNTLANAIPGSDLSIRKSSLAATLEVEEIQPGIGEFSWPTAGSKIIIPLDSDRLKALPSFIVALGRFPTKTDISKHLKSAAQHSPNNSESRSRGASRECER